MLHIYVDADACPVKQEILKVAKRYELKVTFVANTVIKAPKSDRVQSILVTDEFDAADDWIVEHAEENDIVISTDILLAERCLQQNTRALTPSGRIFSKASIGSAVAQRELMSNLREAGVVGGGPAPFSDKGRSKFLQSFDDVIQAVKNGKPL
jgi:uncharacterized protein YaiI (UPF0178 family)